MEPVTYGDRLQEAERAAAAILYFEAFRQKLGPILGPRGVSLVETTLNLDRALVARRGSDLLGLAGIDFNGRSLVGITWPHVRATYGWISGGIRYLALAIFDRTAKPGELLMDGIVVSPSARGHGIGSELLTRVVSTARELGLRQVRLDVVDTNPGARRLYERHGFVATKTESVPWLSRWFGFGGSTTMVRIVEHKPDPPPLEPRREAPS